MSHKQAGSLRPPFRRLDRLRPQREYGGQSEDSGLKTSQNRCRNANRTPARDGSWSPLARFFSRRPSRAGEHGGHRICMLQFDAHSHPLRERSPRVCLPRVRLARPVAGGRSCTDHV